MALMFYLLDSQMKIKRVIETYKSAIWTERYNERGDFELYIPATADIIADVNFNSTNTTQYICRADDTKKCGMIEAIKISTDADAGNYLTVSGHMIEAAIFRRVVLSQFTYTGSAAKTIERLLYRSVIAPGDSHRKINGFTFKNSLTTADRDLTNQYNGENVGEAIEAICKTLDIGYRANFDLESGAIEFEIYEGTNRTLGQTEVPPVIFSNDFNNLLSSALTVNVEPWKNTAMVLGEGQGTSRVKALFAGYQMGIERREMYVNAEQTSTNGNEMTPQTYFNALYDKGQQALGESKVLTETEADVAPNYGFKLNQDYFLGDRVNVRNEYGIESNPRVVEIIEAQDETGYSIIPTFSITE